MGENKKYFFEFEGYHLDPSEHRLLKNGQVIPLMPKAFETLRLLVENAGHLLEKERLMETVWADAFVEEGNLAYTIRLLRKTLGDDATSPSFIENIPRRGYRFIAEPV